VGSPLNVAVPVEATVVVLIERERKVGGDPGYVTRKDVITIS